MKNQLLNLTFAIDVTSGEKLVIPKDFTEGLGEGKWIITIQPSLSQPIKWLCTRR